MIEIDSKKLEHRKTTVFYSSPNLLLQRNGPFVEVERNGEITVLNDRSCNVYDARAVQYLDGVFLVAGNSDALVLLPDKHEWFGFDYLVATDLYINKNKLIFGGILYKLFHFIVYDLEKRTKLIQTQSSQASTLSYKITDDTIYALMGNSQLLAYGYDGEEKWKRFEHQYVIPGLALYKDKIVYCTNNQIKITDGKSVETISVPIIKFNKLEDIVGDRLYGVCNDKHNIFCFDLKKKELLYEIRGNPETTVKKLLITKSLYPGTEKPYDALLYATENNLNLIDLTIGHIRSSVPITSIRSIVKNQNIIITTHYGETFLMREKLENGIQADSIIEP